MVRRLTGGRHMWIRNNGSTGISQLVDTIIVNGIFLRWGLEMEWRGYFLDIEWEREELSRYGLSIEEAQEVVAKALGGENVTVALVASKVPAVRVQFPVNVKESVRVTPLPALLISIWWKLAPLAERV